MPIQWRLDQACCPSLHAAILSQAYSWCNPPRTERALTCEAVVIEWRLLPSFGWPSPLVRDAGSETADCAAAEKNSRISPAVGLGQSGLDLGGSPTRFGVRIQSQKRSWHPATQSWNRGSSPEEELSALRNEPAAPRVTCSPLSAMQSLVPVPGVALPSCARPSSLGSSKKQRTLLDNHRSSNRLA